MTTLVKSLLMAGCILPLSLLAQREPVTQLGKYMEAQVAVNDFSGVVLISSKGKTVYQQAFGNADREWKIPNSPQGKFEIGSLTKQFTAAAILQLAEEHKLDLNDKLSRYFPAFPNADGITLHMLLNHTSGIANYTEAPGFNKLMALPLTKDSVIAIFSHQPPTAPPGAKFSYSNSNYFLLGCIIEQVSKKSYGDYLQANIFQKAGLANTMVNRTDSILALRANGYSRSEKDRWKNAAYHSMEIPFSAGSVISTAGDLLAWQNALWQGKIVSDSSLLKMTTPYLGHYGYAMVIDSFAKHPRLWHSGSIPGFTSQSCRFPDQDISIIVLSNDEGFVGQITDDLSSLLFGLPVRLPHVRKEIPMQTAVLEKYLGKYEIDQVSGSLKFELLIENGKLYLKPDGRNFKMQLKPESETLFFLDRDPEQEFEFILDEQGNVTEIYFTNRGAKFEVEKL